MSAEENEELETETEDTSMRDTLDAAFADDSSEDTSSSAETAPLAGSDVEGGQEGADTTGDTSTTASDTNTDDDTSSTAEQTDDKAPASWTPAAREEWANVPASVKETINKREIEVQGVMKEGAQARGFVENFGKMVQPYQGYLSLGGKDPLQNIHNAIQAAATLQGGTPIQKAEAAFKMIRENGIDIQALDDLLVGNAPAIKEEMTPAMQKMQDRIDEQDRYLQGQHEERQRGQQDAQAETNTEVNAFIKGKEFGEDLRLDMADFMDMAERNGGQPISLDIAYDRAMASRPDLQTILTNRSSAEQSRGRLDRARNAGSSIPQRSTGGGGSPAPTNMREALTEAWNQG